MGAACVLYRTRVGVELDYAGVWLPAQVLAGASIGLAFAALTTATTAGLPPDRLATGIALASCARQSGAVLGIAALIAILHTPSVEAFRHAWDAIAVSAVASAAIAAGLARREGADR